MLKTIKITFSQVVLPLAFAFFTSCENPIKPLQTESSTAGSSEKVVSSAENGLKSTAEPSKPTAEESDIYIRAADETCKCIRPLLEKAKEVEVMLQQRKKMDEMSKVLSEIEKIRPSVERCSEELKAKYGDMSANGNQKRMADAIKIRCKEASDFINNTLIGRNSEK
jgi:hypothetical protein